MLLFMFWMMGNSLSIYTIMFSMQLATSPFKQLAGVNEAFKQFEHKKLNLTLPKLLYIGCALVTLCLAVYKFSSK